MIQARLKRNAASEPKPFTRRLAVINGDDYGFSHGVNRAIIEAHQRGILTSASLMVTADAFDEAVELARSNPRLAVGLHLVLVCGKAALPPSEIPHLVDSSGNFPFGPEKTGLRYQFSAAARRELRDEIRAQLVKFQSTGLKLSHVDGHLHMHSHPVVFKMLIDMASEFGVKVIRLPREELRVTLGIDRSNLMTKFAWWWIFGRLGRYGERRLKRAGIKYADRVYGLLASGRVTEEYLLALIPRVRGELVEIYSHPASSVDGEPADSSVDGGMAELAALLSHRVRGALALNGFEPANYNELGASPEP
jgi:hopanoid biosynthesis associated protein HpnK